jgi:hypothetical protein
MHDTSQMKEDISQWVLKSYIPVRFPLFSRRLMTHRSQSVILFWISVKF